MSAAFSACSFSTCIREKRALFCFGYVSLEGQDKQNCVVYREKGEGEGLVWHGIIWMKKDGERRVEIERGEGG